MDDAKRITKLKKGEGRQILTLFPYIKVTSWIIGFSFERMTSPYSICPYGKPENEVFRQKPLPRDKFSGREVVI